MYVTGFHLVPSSYQIIKRMQQDANAIHKHFQRHREMFQYRGALDHRIVCASMHEIFDHIHFGINDAADNSLSGKK